MGGYGSGRPASGRAKVEHCRSINVERLARDGCLSDDWRGRWEWKNDDGDVTASVGLTGGRERIVLTYRYSDSANDAEDVEERVLIEWQPCRFGGERAYFICPGVVNGRYCGRRVGKLYGANRYFLCRHCHRLSYASQSEPPWDRALRKANKIRRRLGGEAGSIYAFPPRPKGMWQRTYDRLMDETFKAEALADMMFYARAERIFGDLI